MPTPTNLAVLHEHDYPVAMRDGVVLRGTLYRPDAPGQYPVLLHRTPYGTIREGMERYVRAGYVVYAQDCRGRFSSDGEHQVIPLDKGIEALDGYDTVEHLAAQPWSNGDVGQFGASYCGFTTWQTASARPPHLKAMFAETIPPELAQVDFTYGSFRPARRLHWWLNNIAPDWRRRLDLPGHQDGPSARRAWLEQTHVHWLGLLPLSKIADHLPEPLARDVRAWFADPAMRPWKFREKVYPNLDIPNCDNSGWYDHCNGSIDHLPAMQQLGGSELARRQSKLILGPWNHPSRGARTLGAYDFGPNAGVDLIDVRIQWFDHWLKGIDNGVNQWPAVQYFEMGANRWLAADTWPPPSVPHTLHLAPGALADTPFADDTADSYTYDPHDPTPTLWGPELFTLPVDRRQLDHRADILRYRTEPRAEALHIAGHAELVLHAASTAPDTDFFALLIDESPDGTAMPIAQGMVRARYRHGLNQPRLLTPGDIVEYTIRLGATAHCFLPGHRVRLDLASADFPNFDRNHNTGGDDLFETTLRTATQTIHHGPAHPTRLILPTQPE